MRFAVNKGRELRNARKEARFHWHNWYAWHPVYEDGYLYWFTVLERKLIRGHHMNYYNYREK